MQSFKYVLSNIEMFIKKTPFGFLAIDFFLINLDGFK